MLWIVVEMLGGYLILLVRRSVPGLFILGFRGRVARHFMGSRETRKGVGNGYEIGRLGGVVHVV